MNDKQLIETLKNLKEFCNSRKCSTCKFGLDCQIQDLFCELGGAPSGWDIEAIERIINE